MLFSRPGKEPLGGCNVTPFAQEKVDGSTLLIDGAIEVDPLAFDFDVGFIHTPGVADWPCVMIPALFKLRDILLHPPKNSRMGQSDATFRHHLDEVTEAQFKCDVPSHTQNDDLLVKVPTLEQILCRGRFRHPGSYRRIPSLSTVCTRTVGTAKEAISSLRKQKFDLMFLDLQLPDEPGDQVYKTAKQIDPDLNVIVITGYPDSKVLDRILQISPVTVLKKPLRIEQLNQTVKMLGHKAALVEA